LRTLKDPDSCPNFSWDQGLAGAIAVHYGSTISNCMGHKHWVFWEKLSSQFTVTSYSLCFTHRCCWVWIASQTFEHNLTLLLSLNCGFSEERQ
jgi:hypothetical protein